MTSDIATNRYGSIATEIYDIDKPYFALPDTAFPTPNNDGASIIDIPLNTADARPVVSNGRLFILTVGSDRALTLLKLAGTVS